MREGEKMRLMMRPEYGYAMKECKVLKGLHPGIPMHSDPQERR